MVPRPEYPRPSLRRREWENLNGEWEFATGETPRFDRHILVPFCPESKLSGIGELPGDVAWYRRTFDAPRAERLRVHFGAVDYRATVWVNDVEVARHEGGHTPFSADVTGAVRGRGNVLVVRAEDPLRDKTIPRGKQHWTEQPEGIFYTPTTGIWQTVWLEPLPARHVRGLRLRGDLDSGALDFEIDGDGAAELVVTFAGRPAGRWSGSAGRAQIRLEHRQPWHPDTPALYDVEVTMRDEEGRVADRVESYFGLRKIEARDGRVWLNGEPFVQRLVLDQGYFPEGLLTAPSDDHLRADIELARACGFNGARKHQKVEDPRWLYWADRLGYLVWSEMPSFHKHSAEAEHRLMREWADVVRLHRDHPSVAAWVPANESFGLEQIDPSVRSDFLVRLHRMTHELDGSRPAVSNDGWEHALTDLCTLHDYSPPADLAAHCRSLEAALHARAANHDLYGPGFGYRGEPLLITEFGGLRLSQSGGWGYIEVPDAEHLLRAYEGLIRALMQAGPVEGFCYTQLTDVEQEQNGLFAYDRTPKLDPALLRAITQMPKRRANGSGAG
ncbi:MAG TPA: glycoside hydrolase family 2 TIM barrel-domain containing protein [Candidatus Limnocylindrales bacterium]|nr:glycoside hydrolase family 2 TIM barrel-domain containing protein [Candidatus Limnocylindrales bacterium]